MTQGLTELLPANIDDNTRSLVWRILLTLTLFGYIFWANGFIPESGHVQYYEMNDRVQHLDSKISVISGRVDSIESTMSGVDKSVRELRLENIRANIFTWQVRLCELHDGNSPNPNLEQIYEKQILELFEQYRTLRGSDYPLKPCTGMRGRQ